MSEIRAIRISLGLTQAEMADRLGVTQPTLSRFERGVLVPNKRTLLAAQALKSVRRPTKQADAA